MCQVCLIYLYRIYVSLYIQFNICKIYIFRLEEYTANFPEVFNLYLVGQFTEIARQCVEPPLRKIKTKKQSAPQPFQIKPSLEPSVKFMIETVIRFQHEKCPVCKEQCLPDNPMVCKLLC